MNKSCIKHYRNLPLFYRLSVIAIPLTLCLCVFGSLVLTGYDYTALLSTMEKYFSSQLTTPLYFLVAFGFFKISSKNEKANQSDMHNESTDFTELEVSSFKKSVFTEKPMNNWSTSNTATIMVFDGDIWDDLGELKKEVERIESEIIKRKDFNFGSDALVQQADYEVITHLMNTVCHEATFLTDKWYSDAKRIIQTCYNNLLTVQLTLARLDEIYRKYPNSKRFVTLYMQYIHNIIAPYLNSYIKALDSRDANDLSYIMFGFAIMHQYTSYTMPSFSDFFDTIMMIRSQFPDEFNQVWVFSKK